MNSENDCVGGVELLDEETRRAICEAWMAHDILTFKQASWYVHCDVEKYQDLPGRSPRRLQMVHCSKFRSLTPLASPRLPWPYLGSSAVDMKSLSEHVLVTRISQKRK